MSDQFQCRPDCGACCVVPSISSPIPGMPDGKRAFERCIHLDERMRCRIFNSPDRPRVCGSLKPDAEMCGQCAQEAFDSLTELEKQTAPQAPAPIL